jgi:hypothetical protein
MAIASLWMHGMVSTIIAVATITNGLDCNDGSVQDTGHSGNSHLRNVSLSMRHICINDYTFPLAIGRFLSSIHGNGIIIAKLIVSAHKKISNGGNIVLVKQDAVHAPDATP